MTDTEISGHDATGFRLHHTCSLWCENSPQAVPIWMVFGFQARQTGACSTNLLFGGITLEHSRYADLHPQRLLCCFLKLVSPCPLAGRRHQAVSVVISCGPYNMFVLHDAAV